MLDKGCSKDLQLEGTMVKSHNFPVSKIWVYHSNRCVCYWLTACIIWFNILSNLVFVCIFVMVSIGLSKCDSYVMLNKGQILGIWNHCATSGKIRA